LDQWGELRSDEETRVSLGAVYAKVAQLPFGGHGKQIHVDGLHSAGGWLGGALEHGTVCFPLRQRTIGWPATHAAGPARLGEDTSRKVHVSTTLGFSGNDFPEANSSQPFFL